MAYVPVPKDLTAVKSKVFLNLTKRQLICFGGGALIGVPLFFLLKQHMVYVNDTLYQIVDSQPNFADEKSSFNLLGKIENTVSSSEEPKENFQANDDIVGAAVYQYGDNIVVEFEGKYWLYEHYHNTDFDGNSD